LKKPAAFHKRSAVERALNRKTLLHKVDDDKIGPKTEQPKFPIVGIGASAGGLEAFTELLKSLPIDTGMAFIFVQHLDPHHLSLAPEILSRTTKMVLKEATDGVQVEQNHIYLTPPANNLAISNGKLTLTSRVTGAYGQQIAIDSFFQSLAEDQKARAIGVILSGTASDGTQGLIAIKSEGGIALVQEPQSAKFKGMPESAIASGIVDAILNPTDIAQELERISKHPYITTACEPHDHAVALTEQESNTKTESNDSFREIFSLLLNQTHVDFSNYKYSTIHRRIKRQMMLLRCDHLEAYAKRLKANPNEVKSLFNDILIQVTEFFRDPDCYKSLATLVFDDFLKNKKTKSPIRIWVPGCASGEEVYSIVIALQEFMERKKVHFLIQIFGTDISEQAIQKARIGFYSSNIERVVSNSRLKSFFEKVDGGYKVNKSVRDCCLFSKHDLTAAPPFSRVDLISCRNVLIYFASSLQQHIIPVFHYALNQGGYLWLGRSEGIGEFSKLFRNVDKQNKIFFKTNVATPMTLRFSSNNQNMGELPANPRSLRNNEDFQKDAERIALARYAPPSVIINSDMEILKFQGRTVPYLEPGSGLPSTSLLKMARPELLHPLRSLIKLAVKTNLSARQEGLEVEVDAIQRILNIDVVPSNPLAPINQRNYVIFFEDVSTAPSRAEGTTANKKRGPKKAATRIAIRYSQLEQALFAERQDRYTMVEEFEKTQEELTSANEEMQSANEEFQSTNEELETAKEELQSSNEEMSTVNDELQARNNDLTILSNDLNNVLVNTEIPIVIVGNDRRIRNFTPKAKKVFNLIAGDKGRPLSDIKPNFQLNLDEMVKGVTNSLISQEKEVQIDVKEWMRVCVRPYKTIENKTDGAVISLVDISAIKEKLNLSQASLNYAISVADTLRLPLVVLDENLHVLSANQGFAKMFSLVPSQESGTDLMLVLYKKGLKIPDLGELLKDVMAKDQPLVDYEIEHNFPELGNRILLLNAQKIKWQNVAQNGLLLSIDDVTKRKTLERALEQSEERFRAVVEHAQDPIILINPEGKIEFGNTQAQTQLGYSASELIGKTFDMLLPTRLRKAYTNVKDFKSHSDGGQNIANGHNLLVMRKNGSEIPVDISLSPIITAGKSGMAVIIRDISERIAVDKQRLQLFENEKKINQIKDDFLATLSHELRTPLTTILGWAQELRSENDLSEVVENGLSIIEQSAKTQGQLIDDLLDISRIRAGKMAIDVKIIDLNTVLKLTVDSIRTIATKKSIALKIEFAMISCMINADAIRVQQIFWNLLINALKFTQNGGIISIRLFAVETPEQSEVQVQITDTGMGIKPDFLPHIFDRFSQEDSSMSRQYGGLGLGLGLVKSLVEMQNGHVLVESPGEGMGSTFTIIFPVASTSDVPILATPPNVTKTIKKVSERLKNLRILVVDDDISNRELFDAMLTSGGAEVYVAQSAEEGRHLMSKIKPDLLISDISMPGEDGYSLIRKIRSWDPAQGGEIPAIALTAYAGADDISRVLRAGFSAHVAKPVEKLTLFQKIEDLMAAGKSARLRI
jgi:two-component system CheB/CheR fusion protein